MSFTRPLTLTGTYSVLYVPLYLSKSFILSNLLPHHIASLHPSPFLPVTGAGTNADVKDEEHPVVLELGRQTKTGPWMFPGQTFQEAKLEIPFLRHPSSPSTDDTPYTFKQTLIFDTSLMAHSSHYLIGLRAKTGTFSPPHSPTHIHLPLGTNEPVSYGIQDVLTASFQPLGDNGQSPIWSEEMAKSVLAQPWYGERSGNQATKFVFDFSRSSGLCALTGEVSIDLEFFSLQSSSDSTTAEQDSNGRTIFKNASAYLFTAPFHAEGPKTV